MRDRADTRSQRLRLVVFTAGPLPPVSRVLYERLARDPLLDLRGIIVDEYRRPRKPLPLRILRGLRTEGWPWLVFKVRTRLSSLLERVTVFVLTRSAGRSPSHESYEALRDETGVAIHHVADIHSESSLALIRSLQPQLGLIMGGRILRDAVISIPEYGTLNVHKKRVPQYRGGGPTGYWEILAGEREIGVTIHYATSQVDAGPVLAEDTIPVEECDTLESLGIKADILGAQLYHDTVRRFALGDRQVRPQDTNGGRTYRSPSEFKAYKVQESLRRKAARLTTVRGGRTSRRGRIHRLLLGGAPIDIRVYSSELLEDFVKEIEFVRRYFEIVPLDEAIERLRAGNNARRAFAITLLDGPGNNFWALEYQRSFGIPASLFIPTGHVREGEEAGHILPGRGEGRFGGFAIASSVSRD